MSRKRKNRAPHYAPPTMPPPPLPALDVPAFTLTAEEPTATPPSTITTTDTTVTVSPPPFRAPDEADSGEWELPGRNKKPKKTKAIKTRNYPEFVLSPQKLKRVVGLSELQGLVLWLSADAPAPQWLLVRVSSCVLPVEKEGVDGCAVF